MDTYHVNGAISITHLMHVDCWWCPNFHKSKPKILQTIEALFEELFSLKVGSQYHQKFLNILSHSPKSVRGKTLQYPTRVSENKKSFNQCWKLIQPIENLLSRWSGKYLSYGHNPIGKMGVPVGKYTYWTQGFSLPSVAKKIRKFAYKFIWDGRNGFFWSLMILPKSEQSRSREPPNYHWGCQYQEGL